MAHRFTADNGETYEVGPVQGNAIMAAYGRFLTGEEAKNEVSRILRLSEANAPFGLSAEDRAALDAATHNVNLHATAKMLRGRKPEEMFGPGATLCQCHGNAHHMECGCVLHVFFDHHRRHEEGERELHPDHPVKCCKDHPLKKFADFAAHHHAVKKANAGQTSG